MEHQWEAIETSLSNLPVYLGFLNQQMDTPHNQTMKREGARLKGMEKKARVTNIILYQALKHDILSLILPCSKVQQSNGLLMPELLTIISSTVSTLRKVRELLCQCGSAAFLQHSNLFPKFTEIIKKMVDDDDNDVALSLERQTRSNLSNDNIATYFYGYRLQGPINVAMDTVATELLKVLKKMKESFKSRYLFLQQAF